jgi:hypothetical protein
MSVKIILSLVQIFFFFEGLKFEGKNHKYLSGALLLATGLVWIHFPLLSIILTLVINMAAIFYFYKEDSINIQIKWASFGVLIISAITILAKINHLPGRIIINSFGLITSLIYLFFYIKNQQLKITKELSFMAFYVCFLFTDSLMKYLN